VIVVRSHTVWWAMFQTAMIYGACGYHLRDTATNIIHLLNTS